MPSASREPWDVLQRMYPHLKKSSAPNAEQVGVLLSVAHWHLRTASLGWDVFNKALPDGDQNLTGHDLTVVEMAAENLISRGVVSAMDLCAAAVFRLTGERLRPDSERDVGWWFDKRWKQPWHLVPLPLQHWLRALERDATWQLATAFRNAFTHRTVQRNINIVIGGVTTVTLQVGIHKHDAQVLMPQLVTFGKQEFSSFERALASAYPLR